MPAVPRRPLISLFLSLTAAAAAAADTADYTTRIKPLLEAQCFDCHADGAKKGGVAFDEHADDAALLADKELWLRVQKNVRAGLMPPPDKKTQPTSEERTQIVEWINHGVFQLDPAKPDPGRPVLRRLNRTEYRNTIRDLTGVDFRVDEEFPADDSGHGFDNIGEVLNVSPMLLEKYLDAAKSIIRQAVPLEAKVMPEERIYGNRFHRMEMENGAPKKGGVQEVLNYTEPATVTAEIWIKRPGKYSLTFHLDGRERYVEGEVDLNKARLIFKSGDTELGRAEYGHAGGRKITHDFTVDLPEGKHTLTVELQRLTPDAKAVRELGVSIEFVTLRGPQDRQFWADAPGYAKWFPRPVPEDAAGRTAYAREILSGFATTAFRRPVDEETTVRLTKLAESLWTQPGQSFEAGVARAMEAVLASPRFIFREEFTEPATDGVHPFVDQHSLASRLSYFLWSTMPDAALREAADKGLLRAELSTHVQRMLADDKAKAFIRNFTGQWLQARDIEGIPIDARFVLIRQEKPDPEMENARKRFFELRRREATSLTPEEQAEMEKVREVFRKSRDRFKDVDFSGSLRRDMRRETELYFDHIIRGDRPLTELIDSNYTFLNERLARHYGIEGVSGDDFRKVDLPESSPRGGVLTMGTVLAVTSNPTRTSPVKRGMFILENVLGTPPPPPPANVPPLEDLSRGRGVEGSLRENLARHRADPQCASCHNRMDPLGLAFENFNAMASWRDEERGLKIDAAGQLISGESFNGARELKKILVTRHREEFYRCFIEKMLLYALGRGLTWQDEVTVDLLLARLQQADGRAGALIQGIVESDAFLRRRAPAQK